MVSDSRGHAKRAHCSDSRLTIEDQAADLNRALNGSRLRLRATLPLSPAAG